MVVPLELLPRQELLLRDERLRLRPEERRRRQHDPAAALRRPAKAATGGGRRHPAGLHSRSDASAEGPPLVLLLHVDALATLEVLGLGRLAHSGNVVVAAVRRRPEAVVAVPGAGLAFCKRRPTTWLLEARLGWLGRPRAPLRVPGGVALALRFAFGRVMHLLMAARPRAMHAKYRNAAFVVHFTCIYVHLRTRMQNACRMHVNLHKMALAKLQV